MHKTIKTAAIASTLLLASSVAMAEHHENGMEQQDQAIVEDGGVQSNHNPEVEGETNANLDDETIVKDGGTGSDYNAEVAEEPEADLPKGEVAEDGGVDSAAD
ncbi:hypothetical protein QWY79_15130 [Halomonas sabkhae]|uniref:hypothetical protein n=1 Tax=Halomonas sabkhae TaxID=626223 RepID=UPI0025B52855|nr:hypothetical protein [Halomonas sabkhae]MDN3526603.1 hypothetical protein [Halomonas sabkhae]